MAIILTDLPPHVLPGVILAAQDMLFELERGELKVGLVPAPDERHDGHMIRAAVSHNALWYRQFVAARGKNTDRQRVIKALNKIINCDDLTGVYDLELFETVKTWLVDYMEDPDAINFFTYGVPF